MPSISIEFEIPFLYKLSIKFSNQNIFCQVSLFQSSTISFCQKLSLSDISKLKSIPKTLYHKVILLSQDYSKLILNPGLKGGGVCCIKRVSPELQNAYVDIRKLKLNKIQEMKNLYVKISQHSSKLSKSLRSSAISRIDLIKIANTCPKDVHECFKISEVLIKGLDSWGEWNCFTYLDEKALLVYTVRRFFYYSLLYSNIEFHYYQNLDFKLFGEILARVKSAIKIRKLQYLDSFTWVSIKAMIVICKAPGRFMRYWERICNMKNDLLHYMFTDSENWRGYRVPDELFQELSRMFSGNYCYYFLFFDLIENMIHDSDLNSNFVSDVINREFLNVANLQGRSSWKIKTILFNYASKFILLEYIDSYNASRSIETLQGLIDLNDIFMQEICISSLRYLCNSNFDEIRDEAEKMIKKIKDRPDLNIVLKQLVHYGSNKLIKKSDCLKSKFLTGFATYDGIFLRNDSLKLLEDTINTNQHQNIMISGLIGMGKQRLAWEYAHSNHKKYSYIAIIKCKTESEHYSDLEKCARSLDLVDENNKITMNNVYSFLQSNHKRSLVIYTGCDNLSILKDILDKNFQKILISDEKIIESPLNKPNDLNLISDKIHILEVQRLQIQETIELIRSLIDCEYVLNQSSLQKLAEIIDGWPLAARILIPYLKQLNLLSDQDIEELVLNKIDKSTKSV